MARPIWKGHVSFGLVNIPVVLYSAERRADLQFRMLDSRNKARVRYERVNEVTGEEVPWDQIVKAYEYDGGNYVVLTEEDFKKAAVEATQAVEIEDFVDAESIDYRYFDKPYYLLPDKKGGKGYVLLRETLKRTGKAGIAKVVIRTRQYLAALIAHDDALVVNLLRFQQELRDLDEFEFPTGTLKQNDVSSKEMELAEKLVKGMSANWKPEKYHDDYRDALMRWIEKKASKDGTAVSPEPEEDEGVEAGQIINFMDVLKESIEKKSKGSRKGRKKKTKKKTAKKKRAS